MAARTATRVYQASVYQASPIKRVRSTRAEVEARRKALLTIIEAGKPMTVRQVFYQATVQGIVEKAETGYSKVQIDLTRMRRDGTLPYNWLADNTRWHRKPRTFDSVEEALNDTAKFYRKSLWADAGSYVEVGLEKDALSGVLYPITSMYDVPLMISRGMPSLTFLYGSACAIHLITDFNLPTRPTKRRGNTHANSFEGDSVELDALPAGVLREIVARMIEQHVSPTQTAAPRVAEDSERELLRAWHPGRSL